MRRFSVRLAVEYILGAAVVGLSAYLVLQKTRGHHRLTPYGPTCESNQNLTRRVGYFILSI